MPKRARCVWRNDATGDQYQKQPHAAPSFGGVAPQGQLAVAGELLLVPGGRSLPAGFDRASGELKFFSFGGKGQGGSFVAADATRAFVHTRVRGTLALSLPNGTDAKFQVNEPVLAGDVLYTATAAADNAKPATADAKPAATPPQIRALDAKNKLLWQLDADGTGDLIKAGNRLYAAGSGTITAVDLPGQQGPARVAWTQRVEGEVCRLVAAADRLFAVTLDGRVLAFGETRIEPAILKRPEPLPPDGQAMPQAARLLETAGKREGYALWFGVDDGKLLEAVAASSQLQIVGVDPDGEKIDRLRRRLDQAGWYGRRIALQVATLETYLRRLISPTWSWSGAVWPRRCAIRNGWLGCMNPCGLTAANSGSGRAIRARACGPATWRSRNCRRPNCRRPRGR